jgi:hypothetical protein
VPERSIEYAGLLLLFTLFVVLTLRLRAMQTRGRRPLEASPELVAAFREEAAALATVLFDAALERLGRFRSGPPAPVEASAARPPNGSVLRVALAALEHPSESARLLAKALGALRASEDAEQEERQARFDFLESMLVDRYPVLGPAAEAMDLEALERLEERAAALEVLDADRSLIDAGREALRSEPDLVFSSVGLVVLTILARRRAPEDEAKLAARIAPHAGDVSSAERLESALARALAWIHSVPSAERKPYDGVPVMPNLEPALAAVVVRHRISEARSSNALAKGRALAAGEPSLLWLGHLLAEKLPYPEIAAAAFASLAGPARSFVGQISAPDADGPLIALAIQGFVETAQTKVGEELAGALRERLKKLLGVSR